MFYIDVGMFIKHVEILHDMILNNSHESIDNCSGKVLQQFSAANRLICEVVQ